MPGSVMRTKTVHKLYTLVTHVLIPNGGFKGLQTENVETLPIKLSFLRAINKLEKIIICSS